MLNIFTQIQDTSKFIFDVETHFRRLIYNNKFDDKNCRYVLEKIDGVTFKKGTFIVTPFGETHLENISTGCKAILLCIFYKNTNKIVNVTECGENATDLLFDLGDKTEVNVYTKIPFAPANDNIKCRVNNKVLYGGQNIYRELVNNIE